MVEAVGETGEEYGEIRGAFAEGGVTATPTEMPRRIMADLDDYVRNTPQHEDVTCLLIKAD